MFDVIIAGCGPTGAMLAAELRLHGVRVLVLEQDIEPASFVRIVSLHVRSLELLAMRGLLDGALEHGRRRPAAGLFAGIGAPERFFEQLRAMGLRTVDHAFPDHHRFSARDLALEDCDLVLMTEKDAVKCRGFGRSDLVALRVDADVEEGLFALILEKLRGRSAA